MSDQRRLQLKREAAKILRQLAKVLDHEPDRTYLEACADQIEASADALGKITRIGRLPDGSRLN
jgi:hypothetical protein